MKPVLIIQQVLHDTPDYFADFLNEQQIPYEIRRMHDGDLPPATIAGYSGYCMLGGYMSVNDEDNYPFLRQEKALVREAMELDIPVIGHCLGGQLMSTALGGTVSPAHLAEIGWSSIQVADDDEALAWFGGHRTVEFFQWHNETFSIPYNARLIASTAHCRNQAFIIDGKHIGMQFHCEVNQTKVQHWAVSEKDDIDALRDLPSVQSSDYIVTTLSEHIPHSNALARCIYARWIQSLAH
ncbi:GMP synthase-like glutamine amidotransferase [Oxalobacteraceae bacterium GrIS 2.11]